MEEAAGPDRNVDLSKDFKELSDKLEEILHEKVCGKSTISVTLYCDTIISHEQLSCVLGH